MVPEAIHRRRVRILTQDAAVDGLLDRVAEFTSKPASYPQAWLLFAEVDKHVLKPV
jgi:hypothetical protein